MSSAEQQFLAFENLVGEVGAALAEIADTLKERASDPACAEIAQSLADLVGLLEKRKDPDIAGLVKAVQQLRIEAAITVQPAPPTPINVLPAPVHVEIQPAPPQGDSVWEVRIAGQYGAPDRLMTIRKKSTS